MIELRSLLKLQLIYCLLGIAFNLVSWVFIANGHLPLTPTVPVAGIIVMSIYGAFLMTGYFMRIGWYRFLMVTAVVALGYGGVVKHLIGLDQTPELYNSVFSGVIGVLINVFGVVLNLIGATGRFRFTAVHRSS